MAASTSQRPEATSESSTETENQSIVSDGAQAQEQSVSAEQAEHPEEEQSLAKDDIFHILQNERRRQVLRHLKGVDETVEMREIAEKIAAWENDTTVANLYSDQRQRVYIALYQSHLPKLDDLGVINYNQSRGTIEPTPLIDDVTQYLDRDAADTEGDHSSRVRGSMEWAPPAASLGVVTISLIIATQAGLFPVTLGGLVAAVLIAGVVTAASVHAISRDR